MNIKIVLFSQIFQSDGSVFDSCQQYWSKHTHNSCPTGWTLDWYSWKKMANVCFFYVFHDYKFLVLHAEHFSRSKLIFFLALHHFIDIISLEVWLVKHRLTIFHTYFHVDDESESLVTSGPIRDLGNWRKFSSIFSDSIFIPWWYSFYQKSGSKN